MNVPLFVAGCLALLGAAIHGIAGEILVVRRLSPSALPATRFGGPEGTKIMIRASWHFTTIAFLTVGSSLVLSATVLQDEAARAIGLMAAAASTGFAALALGAALTRSPRAFFRHPAPILLSSVAILAWWGVAR